MTLCLLVSPTEPALCHWDQFILRYSVHGEHALLQESQSEVPSIQLCIAGCRRGFLIENFNKWRRNCCLECRKVQEVSVGRFPQPISIVGRVVNICYLFWNIPTCLKAFSLLRHWRTMAAPTRPQTCCRRIVRNYTQAFWNLKNHSNISKPHGTRIHSFVKKVKLRWFKPAGWTTCSCACCICTALLGLRNSRQGPFCRAFLWKAAHSHWIFSAGRALAPKNCAPYWMLGNRCDGLVR